MGRTKTTQKISGPLFSQNWKAAIRGDSSRGAYEYPFFTDAHIVGEFSEGLGPYQLFNTCPDPLTQHSRPTIVLRAEYYLTNDDISERMKRTDDDNYHGGYLQDEIAAVVSLCLGVRLKSGEISRIFGGKKDHRGRPIASVSQVDPIVPQVSKAPVLPSALGTHSLDEVALIANFPLLSSKDAIAFVRAARLYQDALWVVESQPELAWLMLVSAVETAANRWREASESPIERLRASKPDLERILEANGGQELVQEVAEVIAPFMGSTKKFVDFLTTFLSNPPAERPLEAFQFPWAQEEIERSLKKIYDYRSRALHGGKPFPAPMCQPPRNYGYGLEERPAGLAAGMKGSTWLLKDTPMLFHLFEYIVRNALLNWLNKIINDMKQETNSVGLEVKGDDNG